MTANGYPSIFVESDSLTISGVISEPTFYRGGFRKIGNEILNLTGINKFTDSVQVSAGTLRLSGAGSINSTSVIILDGGTLLQNSKTALSAYIKCASGTFGGMGSYVGNLNLGACHLSPGDGGVGTLTVWGNVSLTDSSILDYDFGATAGSCDVVFGLGTVGRTLTLDGIININASTLVNGQYTIFAGFSSITDNGLQFGNVPPGHSYSYTISGDKVIVTVGP